MKEFKPGDRVRVIEDYEDEYEATIGGLTGICVYDEDHDVLDGNIEYREISILFDNPKYNTHYCPNLDKYISGSSFSFEELEYARIRNTAIARKLYPDYIEEEEWLIPSSK